MNRHRKSVRVAPYVSAEGDIPVSLAPDTCLFFAYVHGRRLEAVSYEALTDAIAMALDEPQAEELEPVYCTSYCNQGHSLIDGAPIDHECRKIPVYLLEAEKEDKPGYTEQFFDWAEKHRKPHKGRPIRVRQLV